MWGGHQLPVEGAVFTVISRPDKRTGLMKRSRQMVYICDKTEELVLSRHCMTTLGMINGDIDDSGGSAASVRLISTTTSAGDSTNFHPSGGSSSSGDGTGSTPSGGSSGGGGSSFDSCRTGADGVEGGQLTLDMIASHNQLYPNGQVSIGDLKPNNDPDHVCRGTLPLKTGRLPCGCFPRADAPEPLTINPCPFKGSGQS